jgi:nitroreductase
LSAKLSDQEINLLMCSRRSVFPKDYTGEPVPQWVIEQMLENANWAPNHKQTEPWRFVVFSGEGLKEFADYQAEMYLKNTPKADFQEVKFEQLKQNPLTASHIIAIGMNRQTKGRTPEIEEVMAVACAVQNMCLTATAYNVGAYWSTGGVTYLEEAKSFFGLEEKDKLLGFFYVGEIAKPSPDNTRNPIEEKVTWRK